MKEILDEIEKRRKQIDKDVLYTFQRKDINARDYDKICDKLHEIDEVYVDIIQIIKKIETEGIFYEL